jgi:hypothetical protein
MKRIIGQGIVIAVKLRHNDEDKITYNFPPILSFFPTLLAKMHMAYKDYSFPPFIDTFLKSLQAGSTEIQDENSLLADILIAPDLSAYGFLDIKKDQRSELIKIGYKSTLKIIKMKKLLL